jgi:protein O-GlcNAc transferase
MAPVNIEQSISQVAQLIAANRLAEAEGLCRQVLAGAPDDPAALNQLGVIATRSGHAPQGTELIRRAISFAPARADFHFNLSQALMAVGAMAEAETALRQSIQLAPDFAPARQNLGALLAQQNKLPEAQEHLRIAIALRPNHPATYVNLGRVCRWQQRLDEAIECYRKAIDVAPGFAGAYSALGSALREAGRIGEAVAAFRKAVELKPDFREAHSNLVYAMHFDPDTDPQANFQEHLRWAARFAEPLKGSIAPHTNDRDPDRPLRIGYVSPDLMNHVVGSFMEPIVEQHDHARYQIVCYSDVPAPDDLTRRLMLHADLWRQTSNLSDEQLAQQVRNDRIDVLIDLTLHMRRSRLAMFARKPAPVQITHLAYCATSGMSAMDWCITDPHMSPPGLNDRWFTEKLLRLPETYWCYRPSATSPPVGPLPAAQLGYVTFASLNTFAKVNHRVIELWAQVLQAIPNSRLAVHATMGDANAAARKMITDAGIAPDRLTLLGREQRDQYLELYNRIDIALDPFPYGGGTTSLDALWMGVPLVALAGQAALSRTGVTLLDNLNMGELIAQTPQQYVEIAARLASDVRMLAELRHNLRQRLTQSVLMDAPRYTRNLENAYREAWKLWCRASFNPPPPSA